ncbi:MAG: hypothetical protein E4H31_03085 [Dehalococcoidia bacterium]|nr:MAG: hypothetical protein E4H31_03085 [Dehalococcoidia bacterium]
MILTLAQLIAIHEAVILKTGRQNMKTEKIKAKLTVEPLQFTMEERKKLKITIAATNLQDDVIDPELYRARLFINDRDSLIWADTISNGLRETKWFALPPGETVFMTWSSLGEFLFPSPGEFILVLRLGDMELAPIQVQVNV